MSIKSNIDHFIKDKKSTLLCVGPMSKNCVDATVELANEYNIPIFLIASRRQIETEYIEEGYVNNWTTQEFSKYVKSIDKNKNIILARDHGGPWQGNYDIEKNLDEKKTIDNALKSFFDDIDNNFDFIHIDTSYRIDGKKVSKENSFKLFKFFFEECNNYAKIKKKKIYYEIGTEEQSGGTQTFEEIEENLDNVTKFCEKKSLEKPIFTVIQSGTKVMEMRNIGSFEQPVRIKNEIPVEIQLLKALEICKKYDFYLKEHNTDYLTNQSLSWHPKIGIHAANVAPEFGVAETLSLISLMKSKKQYKLINRFIEIAYNLKKWKKWVIDEKKCTDFDKAIMSGHYIFSSDEFIDLKKEFMKNCKLNESHINNLLKKSIKNSIKRYLTNFKLI